MAIVSAYTMRVGWHSVLAEMHGGTSVLQGLHEARSQVGSLWLRDVRAAADTAHAIAGGVSGGAETFARSTILTMRAASQSSKGIIGRGLSSSRLLMAAALVRLHVALQGSNPFARRARCQPAAQGLALNSGRVVDLFFEPLDGAIERATPAYIRLLTTAAQPRRRKAVAFVALFDGTSLESAGDAARQLYEGLGCDGDLRGQCQIVDIGGLPVESAGAKLQARIAAQLVTHSDSLFILTGTTGVNEDGAAVLLQLLGENGRLHLPGCDVRTTSSVVLLVEPRQHGRAALPDLDAFELALQRSSRLEKSHATAQALRRRLADEVLYLSLPAPQGGSGSSRSTSEELPQGLRAGQVEL